MNASAEGGAGDEIARDQYVDVGTLFSAAWSRKVFIGAVTALIGVCAVLVTLTMPNIYRSSALLTPVSQERPRGLGALGGSLNALAGLAGLNLGGAAVDNTTLGIQTLSSREFLTEFAKRHDLVVPLFAAQGWNETTREWVIDPQVYDVATGTWKRVVEPPAQAIPSDWEIYEVFSRMVSVEQDPKSGLVRVSVESRSPEMSKEWTQQLVTDLNTHMRSIDLAEANRSIKYLEERLAQTSIAEIRLAAIQLIEEQMKTVMLAEARPEYVFRILDPPVVPLEKHAPRRAVLCILATLVGGFFVTAGAIVFHLVRLRKQAV